LDTYTAIVTRYHGPTNTRGSRIVARTRHFRVVVAYDHSLSLTQNHLRAADALSSTLGWEGRTIGGVLPNNDYCWNRIPRD